MEVIIEDFNDTWGIYNSGGQCLESDFETYVEAHNYAIENGMTVVGSFNQFVNEDIKRDVYIYHGTGKGQSMNIQNDEYMKPNRTGEEQPSISFTNDLDYAKYYAKSKGGISKMCILRTKLTVDYQLSPRIVNNKGDEYITFKNVPSSDLEVMTMGGGWQPLDSWNVIFDEPLNV